MPKKITAKPSMLKTSPISSDKSLKIDRKNGIIRGYKVAQAGDFGDGRGHFDQRSLAEVVRLGNAHKGGVGLQSRLGHPNESDDGLTKHLGRSKNFRLEDDGNTVVADLHLAKSAMEEPVGGGKPIGLYVMDRAEEDAGAISSSLVLRTKKTSRKGPDGEPLAAHWMPTELLASDIVNRGAAVHDDLLSVEGLDAFLEGSTRRLPTKLAVAATEYLDQMFPDSDREVLESRMNGFVKRYLSSRFGSGEISNREDDGMDEATKQALATQDAKIEELGKTIGGKFDALMQSLATDREERKKADEQAKLAAAETKRCENISALCEMAGSSQAAKFIADKLSVDQVVEALKEDRRKSSPSLTPANGNNGGTETDPLAKLRAEFDAEKEDLTKKAGFTDREDYVKAMCLDRGLEYKAPK